MKGSMSKRLETLFEKRGSQQRSGKAVADAEFWERIRNEEQQRIFEEKGTHREILEQLRLAGGIDLVGLLLRYSELVTAHNGELAPYFKGRPAERYLFEGNYIGVNQSIHAINQPHTSFRIDESYSYISPVIPEDRVKIRKLWSALLSGDDKKVDEVLREDKGWLDRRQFGYGRAYEMAIQKFVIDISKFLEFSYPDTRDDIAHIPEITKDLGVRLEVNENGVFINGRQVHSVQEAEDLLIEIEVA